MATGRAPEVEILTATCDAPSVVPGRLRQPLCSRYTQCRTDGRSTWRRSLNRRPGSRSTSSSRRRAGSCRRYGHEPHRRAWGRGQGIPAGLGPRVRGLRPFRGHYLRPRVTMNPSESEWRTRRQRIDPKLDAAGWRLPRDGKRSMKPSRSVEEPTSNGPADYALWLNQHIVGVVEAKKLTLRPQNVLTQAQRYAKGIADPIYNFDGFRCPFLYSTNGEVFWFHDVRHSLNRSRRVAAFHTPAALLEMLGRDFDSACDKLRGLPHDNQKLRPYQRDANAAVEKAIAERKRNLLIAMATGTGKTLSLVNEIYRLMKSGVAKRVLFLVDRRALAAQAVRTFSSFDAEPGQKFNQVYEVYSSKFQREDFGEEEKFDPKLPPQSYLTDPKPGQAFVYVAR